MDLNFPQTTTRQLSSEISHKLLLDNLAQTGKCWTEMVGILGSIPTRGRIYYHSCAFPKKINRMVRVPLSAIKILKYISC